VKNRARKKRPAFSVRCPIILIAVLLPLFLLNVHARNTFEIDSVLLDNVEQKHGKTAKKRLLDWQDLIVSDNSTGDLDKLEKVNTFFNRIDFVSDSLLWNQDDYWATPVELIVMNGGDCEDFSIAKYFTLKKMGVDENKLNMTYVKALTLNQAHMVVTYYDTPESEPLILDNLNPDILPASARSDLVPVFSFNGSGLWLAKERSRGRKVGGSERYKRWTDLLQRMPAELN